MWYTNVFEYRMLLFWNKILKNVIWWKKYFEKYSNIFMLTTENNGICHSIIKVLKIVKRNNAM